MFKSFLAQFVGSAMALLVISSSFHATAQTAEEYRDQQNRGVVGIMGGSLTGTYSAMVAELGKNFDDADLRVIPMIGKGSLNAVGDLLYLKGIDAAIVQSDVLDFIRKFDVYNGAETNIVYITKMFNEEVHLVARRGIDSIYDLEGKKVSFGPSTSGGFMTASVVFDELGVTVQAQEMSHDDGLRALRAGTIDALIRVSGAPVKFLSEISWEDGLHIVPLPPIEGGSYVRSTVTSEQYPGLIPQGKSIETVAVVALLAAYNWPADHERRSRVQSLVDRMTSRLSEMKSGKYHPKWQEVDLQANVPGWVRWDSGGS